MMKKCLVCGLPSPMEAPTCPACGEASFEEIPEPAPTKPAFRSASKPPKADKP